MDNLIRIKMNDAEVQEKDGKLILQCSHCNFNFPIEARVLNIEADPHGKAIEADVLKMEGHWNTAHKDIVDEAKPRTYISGNEIWTPKGIDHMIIIGRDDISYEILWYLGTKYDRRELSNEEKGMVEPNPKWKWETGSKYDRYRWKEVKESGKEYVPSKWVRWSNHIGEKGLESTLVKLKAKFSCLDVHNPDDVRVTKNDDGIFYTVEWNSDRESKRMEEGN